MKIYELSDTLKNAGRTTMVLRKMGSVQGKVKMRAIMGKTTPSSATDSPFPPSQRKKRVAGGG